MNCDITAISWGVYAIESMYDSGGWEIEDMVEASKLPEDAVLSVVDCCARDVYRRAWDGVFGSTEGE